MVNSFISVDCIYIFSFILVDFCDPDPCKNNGTCVSGVSTFVCTCKEGFTGKDCGEKGESCLVILGGLGVSVSSKWKGGMKELGQIHSTWLTLQFHLF